LQDEEMEYEGPKNYHIVVGSFKNDAYAQNWLDKTAYGEIDIQYIREYDGWYRVILFSYSSNEQAEITLDAVRNDLKLKAWIAYMN
jgi:cell division protein FtsN